MTRRFYELARVFNTFFLHWPSVTVNVPEADTRDTVQDTVREVVTRAFHASQELACQIILRQLF